MPEAVNPTKTRVLLIPHDLSEPGGGTCVSAWILLALRGRYDISILTWRPADTEAVNRNFGANLRPQDFSWCTIAPWMRRLVALVPTPLALLQNQILYRKAKLLREENKVDLVIGAMNEIDIGEPSIQYIHFPWNYWPRPSCDLKWYHLAPVVKIYRRFASWLSGYSQDRVAQNHTLANSDWTGRLFETCYGVRPRTVYPPVAGGFPDLAFEDRETAFVCIGRMSEEKRIEDIMEILSRVRALGHMVGLRIIGHKESPSYLARLEALAAPHRNWISFHHGIPRKEMTQMVSRCRYGIHAMKDEHFGIAVAELQRAGCISFIQNGGGAPEIVGGNERLVFDSIGDAVGKIDRVLRDRELQATLRRDVEQRGARFTEENFTREIREVVDSFASPLAV